jgi:hypothetical protein
MDVWSHDRNHGDPKDEIKKIGEREGATGSYRRQFGKLWEISVFPLTKLIMDVPGIPVPGIPPQKYERDNFWDLHGYADKKGGQSAAF